MTLAPIFELELRISALTSGMNICLNFSGEDFLRNICHTFTYAKRPLMNRMHEFSKKIGLTFIHGTGTLIRRTSSETLQSLRGEDKVKIHVGESLVSKNYSVSYNISVIGFHLSFPIARFSKEQVTQFILKSPENSAKLSLKTFLR